jgi:hypothetical protein
MTCVWHASPRTRTRFLMIACSFSVNGPFGDPALIVCKAGSVYGSWERERKNDTRENEGPRMESLDILGKERCHLAGFVSLEDGQYTPYSTSEGRGEENDSWQPPS